MKRVALVQMASGALVDVNLGAALEGILEARRQGASLVLLPENFLLFDSKQLFAFAVSDAARDALTVLKNTAKEQGIWVVAGSFPWPASDGRVYARSMVIDASGSVCAHYDKRHLFDGDVADEKGAYRESSWVAPGDAITLAQTPVGQLGLSVCYDLRFPEHFQRLRNLGAELLSVPSAFTELTGAAHWEVLLRARAIETQCYVLGAGQGGDHGNRRLTYGHSMLIDPWGEVVARANPKGFDVVSAEVDRLKLDQLRSEMPVQKQRCDPF